MSPTPPPRGPPSRAAPRYGGGDPTLGGATIPSDEGAAPMPSPPDPSEVLHRRGGTLEPVTGNTGSTGGGAPTKDVAHLWMLRADDQRRIFRVEGGVVAALLLWLGTMVLACAGWRLAGW